MRLRDRPLGSRGLALSVAVLARAAPAQRRATFQVGAARVRRHPAGVLAPPRTRGLPAAATPPPTTARGRSPSRSRTRTPTGRATSATRPSGGAGSPGAVLRRQRQRPLGRHLHLRRASTTSPGDVHDPIDARAIAISDGAQTVVVVSVVAQGIFENYIDRDARAEARALRPGITDVIVSANHNESSPDTIGIYGAPPAPEDVPALGGAVGLNSGIDDYYMDFLVERVATAAVQRLRRGAGPATLCEHRASACPAQRRRSQLSNNFPTTNDDGTRRPRSTRRSACSRRATRAGKPIVDGDEPRRPQPGDRPLRRPGAPGRPLRRLARLLRPPARDQDGRDGDVPGRRQRLRGGPADRARRCRLPRPDCPDGCYAQAAGHGRGARRDAAAALARAGAALRGRGRDARPRSDFFVPLENNLFKAAAAGSGSSASATLYTDGQPTGRVGQDLRTEVGAGRRRPRPADPRQPRRGVPGADARQPLGHRGRRLPGAPEPARCPTWHAARRHPASRSAWPTT